MITLGQQTRPQKRRTTSRVTISDLAEALSITKSTVSRAMNGYPDISEATRLRVLKTAERMGYRPLSQAQVIRTGRSRAIGLVIQMGDHDVYRPFLAEFLAGLSTGATSEGWTLTISTSDTDDGTLEAFRALLDDRKADGFILPRTLADDHRVEFLRAEGVPFVMFGRTNDDRDCAWYDIEGEVAMAEAVAHLAALGHQRIGFIRGGEGYTYADLREAGFRAGMATAGLPVDEALISGPAVTRDAGEASAAPLLDQTDPPTAIVCAVDMAALGVYRAATARGLVLGRDLSVTGYDGIPEAEAAEPPLTTFFVDHRRAGERLAALLIARIRGTAPETLRELDLARFHHRGSTGAPASRRSII